MSLVYFMKENVGLVEYPLRPFFPALIDYDIFPRTTFPRGLINLDDETLMEELLELIDEFGDYGNLNGLSGIVGEHIANMVFTRTLGAKLESINKHRDFEIRQICKNMGNGNSTNTMHEYKEYVLNSSEEHVLKTAGKHRIVILRKSAENDPSAKGHYTNSEIDGLFQIKVPHVDKANERALIAVESKVGVVNIDPDHVINNVVNPLAGMYQCQIYYSIIGMRDEMCDRGPPDKFKGNIREVYNRLDANGIRFLPIVFPFTAQAFNGLIDKIREKRTGWKRIYGGGYDPASGKAVIYTPDGKKIVEVKE